MDRKTRNIMLGVVLSYFVILIAFTASNYRLFATHNQYDLHFEEHPVIPVITPAQGVIDTANESVFYWVQLSDIHLNTGREIERFENFEKICADINSTIRPAFVISTGDNVDGGFTSLFTHRGQDESEYQAFNQTLVKYGFNATTWFPVIGNHEIYQSGINREFWYRYIKNTTQYAVDIDTGFGRYRFYMADTIQHFGSLTPFNIFGEMHADKVANFEKLVDYGDRAGINETVVAGHFPLVHVQSAKTEDGQDYEDLILETGAQYLLVGHLHNPGLYKNHGNFTEAHCPSMKENEMYRICAFDDDIMSFSDQTMGSWPAVVVTSPINARFYNPNMPLDRLKQHTEIRALIFDTNPITEAYVEIDGERVGDLHDYEGDHLWTLPWNPATYSSGVHHIKIVVTSISGSVEQEFDFVLDDFTPLPIEIESIVGWYFSTNVMPLLALVFMLIVVILVLRLLLPLAYYRRNIARLQGLTPALLNEQQPSYIKRFFQRRWLQAALMPAGRRNFFLFIVGVLFFLPLIIAPLAGNTLGGLWIYAILVDGTYILTPNTLIHGTLYAWGLLTLEIFLIRGTENKVGNGAILSVLGYFLFIGVILIGESFMLGGMLFLLSPATYLYFIIPLIVVFRMIYQQRQEEWEDDARNR